MFAEVEFDSQGVTLRGRLYSGGEPGTLRPTVVMANGFTATITMVTDKYAEVFAEAGFVVLLYDHAGFGRSDGDPRLVVNPWLQARGYWGAVSYVRTVPGVDPSRIAVWGDSLAGGVALVVATVDDRVAAAVAQVPVFGPKDAPADPGGALFAALRQTLFEGNVTGPGGTSDGPRPVVSADQLGTPSLLTPITAFRWFIDYGARHGTGWQNVATRFVPDTPVPFQAGLATPHLRVPSFWVLAPADEMPGANPGVARTAYENAAGQKELLEVDGGHFGIAYWPSDLFDESSTAQADFLTRVLD